MIFCKKDKNSQLADPRLTKAGSKNRFLIQKPIFKSYIDTDFWSTPAEILQTPAIWWAGPPQNKDHPSTQDGLVSSDAVEWCHSRRSTRNIFPICSDPDISNGRCARGIQARWFPWVRMPYDPGFYIFKGARESVSAVTAAFLTERSQELLNY